MNKINTRLSTTFIIYLFIINTGQTELADSAQGTALSQIKTIHIVIYITIDKSQCLITKSTCMCGSMVIHICYHNNCYRALDSILHDSGFYMIQVGNKSFISQFVYAYYPHL